jgi:NitT/TauT family transport system substrate-binding protein
MLNLEYGIPTDKEGIQLRLGIEKGFFREQGLDLSLRVVYGGPEIAARYDSGELAVGELGSPPATTALARGARFCIIGSGVRRRALQYFVAAPGFEDWPALRGARVAALSVGSCSYWFARTVLQHHGLDPDSDVELIGLGPRYPRIVELFRSGELQAAVLSEPNLAIGEYHGAFRMMQALTHPDFCPKMQWTVTVANRDFAAREPEVLRALLRGCSRSYWHAAEHPRELAEFGARQFGIDAATMQRAIERERPDLHYDCRVDLPGLAEAIALQRRLGAITTPLDPDAITDMRYLPELRDVAANERVA